MASSETKRQMFVGRYKALFHTFAWIGTSLLAFAALILPISARPSSYTLAPGDVAPQDIQAPYSLDFSSEILTNQAKADAIRSIQPVYLPADPAISRKQIERLRTALNFISVVRFDSYANNQQKLADLSKLTDLEITAEDANFLLELNEVRWDVLQRESLSVVEQVMRDSIREDQVTAGVRRIPTLISFTLPQDQAALISNLITPFITANSLYDKTLTEEARAAASEGIVPVHKKFITGEIIVRRGQVISNLVWEALAQYGLIRPQTSTQDYLSVAAIVAVISGFAGLYLKRRRHSIFKSLRTDIIISSLFLLFLFSARLAIPNRAVIPYLFPVAAFGLIISLLFNQELGLVLSLVISILAGYGLTNSLDITLFYMLGSMVGILILGKGQRLSTFLWAGMAIGLTGAVVTLAYRLTNPYTDLLGMATLVGAAFFSGIASAGLAMFFQYLLSQLLGVPTALQLLEISRPDHPLLQFILQNAPGSYQHSLQVAVLAEQAAEKIGADSMLVRVGGLYHDSGKALNPSFFIENQAGNNLNTHDDLDPAVSAKTIIDHVTNGVSLARKFRLPLRIQDFIREHHGTLLTRYQYTRAVQMAGNSIDKVDKKLFQYPGPIPGSLETALLMLADGCHARVRAELPQTEEEIRAIVRKSIDFCEKEGQLDNTRLTLRDLSLITDSFVDTLKNTYHPRIKYPEISPATIPQSNSNGPSI